MKVGDRVVVKEFDSNHLVKGYVISIDEPSKTMCVSDGRDFPEGRFTWAQRSNISDAELLASADNILASSEIGKQICME